MKVTEHDYPWRHFEIEGLFLMENIKNARMTVPLVGDYQYDNDCERRKQTTELRDHLSNDCNFLLDSLTSREMVDKLSAITGIPLEPDFTRRCAGIQLMFPGGYLNTHLDAALHPNGLERRANLILYLDNVSHRSGGGLQLCLPNGEAVKTIYPAAGTAILWPCEDYSYHGVEQVSLTSGVRYSAAAFYLGPRRPGVTRERSLFIPNRGA